MLRVEESYKLELRNRLHWLLEVEHHPLHQHPEMIRRLATEYPHTIQLVQEQPDPPHGGRALTCHAFSLDLLDAPRFTTPQGTPLVPSSEFVKRLIGTELSECEVPEESCLVVYFDRSEIQHSGRWRSGRVMSKWGDGHVWSHEIFETPATYGCMVRTLRALDPAQHLRVWLDFIRPLVVGSNVRDS